MRCDRMIEFNDSFCEQGYAQARSALPMDRIKVLQKEAARLQSRERRASLRGLAGRSELFRSVASELIELLGMDQVLVRSILFDKTVESNWPVAWHQDLTIAVSERRECTGYGPWSEKDGIPHVQPPIEVLEKMVTLRLHLDPATERNGALRVIPESHLGGKLGQKEQAHVIENWEKKIILADAGDLLLMKPLLLHSSRKSRDVARSRRIAHFEFAPGGAIASGLEWAERGRVG